MLVFFLMLIFSVRLMLKIAKHACSYCFFPVHMLAFMLAFVALCARYMLVFIDYARLMLVLVMHCFIVSLLAYRNVHTLADPYFLSLIHLLHHAT